jgi:hypothetical protein
VKILCILVLGESNFGISVLYHCLRLLVKHFLGTDHNQNLCIIKVVLVLNQLSTVPWRHMEEWRYSSTILDLSIRWRRVVSFTGFDSRHCKCFLSFRASRPALVPTQPPIQWVPATFPGGKAAGTWSWPLAPIKCWGQEWYIPPLPHMSSWHNA